jgi:peptidoglycan/xylan/chitin deacetylase (PgdA/CDA1 family)
MYDGPMRRAALFAVSLSFAVATQAADPPRTTITKWQDGKDACVSITFDDSTINQFRIALPFLNERGLPATFFVITGGIPGSRHQATFVGRPIMDILRDSGTIPTTKENVLERSSMLWYLGQVQRVELLRGWDSQRVGRMISQGNYAVIDEALTKLRESGATYAVAERPRTTRDDSGSRRLTWEEFRKYASQGHEFASHTVSHPYLPALDEANIIHQVEKSVDDIREQLGRKHTFSIEGPYGIHDERVGRSIIPRLPLTRNWVTDEFMDGIMRGDSRDPLSRGVNMCSGSAGPLRGHRSTP